MTEVPTDPQSRRRLREIQDQIETLRGEGARVLYLLGGLLREVDDGELWRAGGHANFSAWLEDEAGVARGTAYRAMNVSLHFSEEIAVRYGLDKLYLGLRYMEITRKVERPGDLIAADLRLRGRRGHFVSVPFHEATVRQVQDAINLAVQSRPRALPGGLDGDTAGWLDRLEAALPGVPDGVRPARRRVEAQRTRSGKILLTFRQIALEDLEGFMDALRARPGGAEG